MVWNGTMLDNMKTSQSYSHAQLSVIAWSDNDHKTLIICFSKLENMLNTCAHTLFTTSKTRPNTSQNMLFGRYKTKALHLRAYVFSRPKLRPYNCEHMVFQVSKKATFL